MPVRILVVDDDPLIGELICEITASWRADVKSFVYACLVYTGDIFAISRRHSFGRMIRDRGLTEDRTGW